MAPHSMTFNPSTALTVTPWLSSSPQPAPPCLPSGSSQLYSKNSRTHYRQQCSVLKRGSIPRQQYSVYQRGSIAPSPEPRRVEAAAKRRSSGVRGRRRGAADVAEAREEQPSDTSSQPSSSSATTTTLPSAPSPSTSASSPSLSSSPSPPTSPPSPLPSPTPKQHGSSSTASEGRTQGAPASSLGDTAPPPPAPAPREDVLRACAVTSASLAAAGLILRQVRYSLAADGLSYDGLMGRGKGDVPSRAFPLGIVSPLF